MAKVQQHFVVVQWGQRETGRTLRLNKSPDTLSVALIQHDAYMIVLQLLRQFGHKKRYLASHSWCSFLGFDMADKHPELLYAYILISGVVDMEQSE